MADRHPYWLVGDQVGGGQLRLARVDDLCAAHIGVSILDVHQCIPHDAADLLRTAQQSCEVLDQALLLLELVLDSAPLQTGQTLEGHVEYRLGLGLAQLKATTQIVARAVGGTRAADRSDHFIQFVERSEQAF